MITFKTYLEEKISAPIDMGIFKKVVYEIHEIIKDYKNGINKDWFEGDGSMFDFMINFKNTPFEKLGRRKLSIIISDNFKYPQYFEDIRGIQLPIQDIVDEYPRNSLLNHELVHYLQDLSKKYDIPWGTTTNKLRRKYKNTTVQNRLPNEYISYLIQWFSSIRDLMKADNISKQEIIDYMLNKNDKLDYDIGVYEAKLLLSHLFKRSPDIAKRYIKKLYTSL